QPARGAVAGEAEGVAAREQVAKAGEQAEPLPADRPELDVETEHRDDLVAAGRPDDAPRTQQDDRRLLLRGPEGAPRERERPEQAAPRPQDYCPGNADGGPADGRQRQ